MAVNGRKTLTLCSASLLILLGFAAFFQHNFRTIQVQGRSMHPTFQTGNRLLASSAYWLVGPIRQGDVVVVQGEQPGEHVIKRVYRLENETVDWLNIPESYDMSQGRYIVPSNSLYVLGDNREESEDSRQFGPVLYDRIIGKIVLKRWL